LDGHLGLSPIDGDREIQQAKQAPQTGAINPQRTLDQVKQTADGDK
jgi:hypothetical protein